MSEKISFKDWQKLDIRIGKILKAEDIHGADKLYKLEVEIGEEKPRTLVAGIKEFFNKQELVGRECVVFCNLKPATFKGVKSEGMILAADIEGKPILIKPEKEVKPGTKIR